MFVAHRLYIQNNPFAQSQLIEQIRRQEIVKLIPGKRFISKGPRSFGSCMHN